MSYFKPTDSSTVPSLLEPVSEATSYWKESLDETKVVKEYGAINSVDISSDHDILVTSSNRLTVYEYFSLEVKKTYTASNFAPLSGATFRRQDNKLIVCGSPDGLVRVWDIKNSKPMRLLGERKNKNKQPVRKCFFMEMSQVVAFSDDKTVKIWDIAEESIKGHLGQEFAHDDAIRAGLVVPEYSLIMSGSNDKNVKIWDARSPLKPTQQYNHGFSVEDIAIRNMLVISVGGETIKVFDIVAGKTLKTINKAHHKIITCACNYGSYLITGSIDGYVKVYDSSFKVATSLTYAPGQVLSCALDDKVLAVGAIDGLVSVNTFKAKTEKKSKSSKRYSKPIRYFKVETVDDSMWNEKSENRIVVRDEQDGGKKRKLAKHDFLLKGYNHSASLDKVLKQPQPEIIVSFFQELIRRSALRIALAGRTDKQLRPIVDFLINNLRDPKFSRILVDVALILTEIYFNEVNRSSKTQEMFNRLNSVVKAETNAMNQILMITGQLNSILNYSSLNQ